MTSIRQFSTSASTQRLPDWRNMGVMLRLVLGVHGVMLLLALYAAPAPAGLFAVMFDWAALLEPALLFSLSLRMSQEQGQETKKRFSNIQKRHG